MNAYSNANYEYNYGDGNDFGYDDSKEHVDGNNGE